MERRKFSWESGARRRAIERPGTAAHCWEPIIRLIPNDTVVRVRLDRKATSQARARRPPSTI